MPARRPIAVAVATLLCLAAVAVPASAADPNHAPVAVDDPNASCGIAAFGGMYPIPEDPKDPAVLAIGCAPLVNDTDADGDILVPELVTDAGHGTATVWGDPAGTWNQATYLPDDDFNTGWGDQPGGSWESDHFTYRVTDGTDWSEPAAYRFWIAPVNDPPTFTAGAALVEAQQDSGAYSGQWATAISPGPYEAYQHVHFEVTKVQVTGVPNLFAVNPAIDDDGVLTFTPGTHEYGLSQVTVRAVDDGGLEDWNLSSQLREQPDDTSDEVTFEIVVWPNHAPEASTDDIAVGQGAGPTSVDVLGNDTDSDGDAMHVSAVTQGEHGAVAITGGGSALTYDPDGMYTGSDWFTYTVTDARGGTDTQFVTVTVAPDCDAAGRRRAHEVAAGAGDRGVDREGAAGLAGQRRGLGRRELPAGAAGRDRAVDGGFPAERGRDVGHDDGVARDDLRLPRPRHGRRRQRRGVGDVPGGHGDADPGGQLGGRVHGRVDPRSRARACPAGAPATRRPRRGGPSSRSRATRSPWSPPGGPPAATRRS